MSGDTVDNSFISGWWKAYIDCWYNTIQQKKFENTFVK